MKVADLITDIRYGFTGSAVPDRSGIGFIRVTDIDENGFVDYTKVPGVSITEKEAERYLLEDGDCIIARSGSVGKAHIYAGQNTKEVFASYLIRLRFDKQKIHPKYFGAFTRSNIYWKQIESNKQGGVQQNINTDGLSRIEVPLPDLKTQQKIASILAQADAARQKRKQANQLTEQFLQSAFLEMFGDPVRNEKGWEVKLIEDISTKVSSGSTPLGGASVYQTEGITFIRSQNVLMNKFDYSDVAYISHEIHNDMKRTWLKTNDVLLNITGASIGRTAVYKGDNDMANVNQHVCIIRPDFKKVNPDFLSFLISIPTFQDSINSNNSGATRQAFNFEQIKNFKIPIPPLSLQQRFAALVEQTERLRTKQRESERELDNLFQSLMQRYFG